MMGFLDESRMRESEQHSLFGCPSLLLFFTLFIVLILEVQLNNQTSAVIQQNATLSWNSPFICSFLFIFFFALSLVFEILLHSSSKICWISPFDIIKTVIISRCSMFNFRFNLYLILNLFSTRIRILYIIKEGLNKLFLKLFITEYGKSRSLLPSAV